MLGVGGCPLRCEHIGLFYGAGSSLVLRRECRAPASPSTSAVCVLHPWERLQP